MRYSHPDLIDRLAAEYALGTLHGGARRRFIRLLADRADVRLAVAQWEQRLSPLANSISPVNPPAAAWHAIEQRTRPAEASRATTSWWQPASWGLGGLAAGVSLCAAVLFTAPTLLFTADQIAMRSGEKLPQSYVGVLTDAQGNGRLLVSSLRHGKTVTVKVIGAGELGSEQESLQLWALPPANVNGGTPFFLVNVPVKGSAQALLPDTSEKLLSKITKLTVNKANTAQPGTPGELVLSGSCAKLW
jgi:anti-sigma-K factor RskA